MRPADRSSLLLLLPPPGRAACSRPARLLLEHRSSSALLLAGMGLALAEPGRASHTRTLVLVVSMPPVAVVDGPPALVQRQERRSASPDPRSCALPLPLEDDEGAPRYHHDRGIETRCCRSSPLEPMWAGEMQLLGVDGRLSKASPPKLPIEVAGAGERGFSSSRGDGRRQGAPRRLSLSPFLSSSSSCAIAFPALRLPTSARLLQLLVLLNLDLDLNLAQHAHRLLRLAPRPRVLRRCGSCRRRRRDGRRSRRRADRRPRLRGLVRCVSSSASPSAPRAVADVHPPRRDRQPPREARQLVLQGVAVQELDPQQGVAHLLEQEVRLECVAFPPLLS